MAQWGDKRTIQFIHLYRDYECLWKPTSPLYKNKIARANAYTKIQEGFSMTQEKIKKKSKVCEVLIIKKRIKWKIQNDPELDPVKFINPV
ncbi:unnamed protein product [Parnassius apollo]|uniref:(apollo) hypothetical protein n=1 Tax=Parnassius apollo TaxID=110799 RepID=A0A8S3WMB7_PARAO|nr:unnamed protein product [Parnassius apollo]